MNPVTIDLPEQVLYILSTLEERGFEAYAVGGCVRDSLLGTPVTDWDICTAALPEQTIAAFEGHKTLPTGLKYGTVTILLDGVPYEVTTYRTDGKYSDNRHPDKVKFVNVLKRDIARRDFTVNALAYNPKTGVVDYYGGAADLTAGIIKSVGNPDKRFGEDALRIMRALRFAATLGFSIEERTSVSILHNKHLLRNVPPGRINRELGKLLVGRGVGGVLRDYAPVMAEIIPELGTADTAAAVSAAPPEVTLRLAALLRGVEPTLVLGHLTRLKYDKATAEAVSELVRHYDAPIEPTQVSVRRWLSLIGLGRLRQLAALRGLDGIPPLVNEIIGRGLCYSLKGLAVNGADLLAAGVPSGVEVGKTLARLLELVVDGALPNEREALLGQIEKSG